MSQTKTWKETCTIFNKYAEWRLWANIFWNLLRFLFSKNNFFTGKKTKVETISVAITDSSNVRCLDLNLINVFMKSKKAERCTDVMFKLTLQCLSVTVEDLNL